MGADAPGAEVLPDPIDIVEMSPVATLVVTGSAAPNEAGRVLAANAVARELLGLGSEHGFAARPGCTRAAEESAAPAGPTLAELLGARADLELAGVLAGIAGGDDDTGSVSLSNHLLVGPRSGSGDGGASRDEGAERSAVAYSVHLRPTSGAIIVQMTPVEDRRTVDSVVVEQQRFRTALMELSEQASTTEDDDEFYRRLIELAVDVVPGAQGGSVQLNVPGTTRFRFVAACGYDLDGLRRHDLQQDHFFRDAWNPVAQIVRNFSVEGRSAEITDWLETVGRLSEIVVNVSAPVLSGGFPVAFLSLDNFEDPEAMTETSIEMTTVLSRLIGELWRRRELEAEVRKEREAYRHLALHDPLTGLANRRSLEAAMADRLRIGRRRGHPQVVLFVDIDDFKGVNDRLGHETGDRLLSGVAEGLEASVRLGDVVGRWGGDEFLILPIRMRTPDEAMILADRILGYFESELDLDDEIRLRARLTIGVGWDDSGEASADDLVRAADEALYEAKAAGKGLARLLKL